MGRLYHQVDCYGGAQETKALDWDIVVVDVLYRVPEQTVGRDCWHEDGRNTQLHAQHQPLNANPPTKCLSSSLNPYHS